MISHAVIIIFNQQDIIRDTFDTTHNNKSQNIQVIKLAQLDTKHRTIQGKYILM